MNRPPLLPTWLLKCLGCSPNNDAVLGDLAERRNQGKSLFWYWRQVVTAIVIGFLSQFKHHPRPVLRGIAAGWIANAIWLMTGSVLFRESLFPKWIMAPNLELLLGINLFIVVLAAHASIGWVISRTSLNYRKTAVIGYLVTNMMYGAVDFGWQRLQLWRATPRIEPSLYLWTFVFFGGLSLLFSIITLTATLFGSGLLTSSSRK